MREPCIIGGSFHFRRDLTGIVGLDPTVEASEFAGPETGAGVTNTGFQLGDVLRRSRRTRETSIIPDVFPSGADVRPGSSSKSPFPLVSSGPFVAEGDP